jgi:hypothetical protein
LTEIILKKKNSSQLFCGARLLQQAPQTIPDQQELLTRTLPHMAVFLIGASEQHMYIFSFKERTWSENPLFNAAFNPKSVKCKKC